MAILVAYYSRSGSTKKVAEALASELGADIEVISDNTQRSGLGGIFKTAFGAMGRKPTTLKNSTKPVSKYDMVIVGGPVWVMGASAPIVAYLKQNSGKFKSTAYFCTAVATPGMALANMETASGSRPSATLRVLAPNMFNLPQTIKPFVQKVRSSLA